MDHVLLVRTKLRQHKITFMQRIILHTAYGKPIQAFNGAQTSGAHSNDFFRPSELLDKNLICFDPLGVQGMFMRIGRIHRLKGTCTNV